MNSARSGGLFLAYGETLARVRKPSAKASDDLLHRGGVQSAESGVSGSARWREMGVTRGAALPASRRVRPGCGGPPTRPGSGGPSVTETSARSCAYPARYCSGIPRSGNAAPVFLTPGDAS